ncbi:MAG: nucleotidyl transferase AbiEii/AbiGii toxin family protein [Patescibacteria group bacterium]|nr:nucleotidyl transferase AbiEii/AbiGii toxin family protein [Patescibacteria group bacterium]
MGLKILSNFQKKVLDCFKKTPLVKKFYLAGGTALAEFYLGHRKSEDLDFFTQEELVLEEIKKFAGSLEEIFPLDKIEYQHGFGLYTFFFYPRGEVVKYKVDFGQYPFGPIERLKNQEGLLVEGLYDIAVDKAHTVSIMPRLRDFVDLFFILQKEKDWKFKELVKQGQEKFEIVVDPVQLGQNLLQVKTLADMPIMLKKIDIKEMQKFFLQEAKFLKKEIFE